MEGIPDKLEDLFTYGDVSSLISRLKTISPDLQNVICIYVTRDAEVGIACTEMPYAMLVGYLEERKYDIIQRWQTDVLDTSDEDGEDDEDDDN